MAAILSQPQQVVNYAKQKSFLVRYVHHIICKNTLFEIYKQILHSHSPVP